MIRKPLTRRAKKRKLVRIIKNVMAIRLQKAYRKYSQRMINKDEKSMINDGEYCNDSTLTGVQLEDVNEKYFYKNDGYFFDIRELETMDKHPYTNKEFSLENKRQIKRILYYLKTNYYSYRELNEEDDNMSPSEVYTAYKTDVFKKIEETGIYLPIDIFDKYTIMQLHIFLGILFNYILIKDTIGINYYLNEFKKCFYQSLCGLCDNMTLKYKALYILDYISKLEDEDKLSRCLIIRRCLRPISIIEF